MRKRKLPLGAFHLPGSPVPFSLLKAPPPAANQRASPFAMTNGSGRGGVAGHRGRGLELREAAGRTGGSSEQRSRTEIAGWRPEEAAWARQSPRCHDGCGHGRTV